MTSTEKHSFSLNNEPKGIAGTETGSPRNKETEYESRHIAQAIAMTKHKSEDSHPIETRTPQSIR